MSKTEVGIMIEEELFEKLKDAADETGCSIEEFIIDLISDELDPDLEEI